MSFSFSARLLIETPAVTDLLRFLAAAMSSTEAAQEICAAWYFVPVRAASCRSRAKGMVSASRGMPLRPRMVAKSPSFITPSPVRPWSATWWMTVMP
ncbi:hypothetical protein D3C72_2040420 [compost metagenome]